MIKYPFTINDLMNTDALAKAILALQEEVKNFVVANTIKYADPIQWNITTQYERNTVVIDPLTGTAYISVQPVPMGVSLANTDYWTVVFNLSTFVTRAARNFSLNYEENTTITATFPTVKGGWLVWNDTLYVANVNITPGDQYVDEVGGNITRITVESIIGNMDNLLTTNKDNMVNIINEVYTAYSTLNDIIGDMSTLDVPGVTNVVAALNVLYTAVDNIANAIIDLDNAIGDLNNLATTDKSSIVAAVNEVLDDINDVDTKVGDLDNLATTDKTSIVAAVNEVLDDTNDVDTKVGDLNDLTTQDKSSIVAAINDMASILPHDYITPDMFGAVGDGVTDDYQAIADAMAECQTTGKDLYFPNKDYFIGTQIDIDDPAYDIYMDGHIVNDGSFTPVKITFAYKKVLKLKIKANYVGDYVAGTAALLIKKMTSCIVYAPELDNFENGIYLYANAAVAHNIIYPGYIRNCLYGLHINHEATGYVNENLFIGGRLAVNSGSVSYYGQQIGIFIESNNGNRPNSNRFLKYSAEDCYASVKITKGMLNFIDDIRTEGSTYALYCDGNDTFSNKVTASYGTAAKYDTSEVKTNEVSRAISLNKKLIFDGSSICVGACSNDTEATFSNTYICGLTNVGGKATPGKPKYYKKITDCIDPNGNAIYGVVVDTSINKSFYIEGLVGGSSTWNAVAVLYDSNGDVIDNNDFTPTSNLSIRTYGDNTSLGASYWRSGGFAKGRLGTITVPDTCKKMFIGVICNLELYGFKVYQREEQYTNIPVVYEETTGATNLFKPDINYGLSSIPTKSGNKCGDFCPNTDTSNPTLKGWFYDGSTWQPDYINSTP